MAAVRKDRCLFQEFIEEYARKTTYRRCLATIDKALNALAENGRIYQQNLSKHLGGGLYEIRTRGGLRVTFFAAADTVVILGHSIAKKQTAWPIGELNKARRIKREIEEAIERGTLNLSDESEEG